MLNKKSIALAKTLVSNEGAFLYPRAGSILQDAVQNSLPLLQSHKPSFESYGDVLYENAAVTVGEVSPHEGAVMTAAESVGGALIRQLNYVRTIVVPFISSATACLMSRLTENEPKEFTIEQFDPSPLVYSSYVAELVKKYKPNSPAFTRITTAPEKSDAELIDGMRTGIGELDDVLAAAIAKYGSDTVVEIYDLLFRGVNPTGESDIDRFISGLLVKGDGNAYNAVFTEATYTDLGIIAFFLVNSFQDNVIAGTGLTLQQYQGNLNAMTAKYGFLIQQGIEWYNMANRNGTLVLRTSGKIGVPLSNTDAEILVFGPVYRQALTQGVTPEVVIGGVIDPKGSQRRVTQFIQNKDENLRRWTIFEKRREQLADDTYYKRLVNQFVPSIQSELDAMPLDKLPEGYSREAAIASLVADVNSPEFLQGWKAGAEGNLFLLVKSKVCKYVFTFVDAEDIIDAIEQEMSENNYSGTDAGYYAALRYLSRWLVMNFDVCPIEVAEAQGLLQPSDEVVVAVS